MIKAYCQLRDCIVQTVSGGVMIAPRPTPGIKVATAVERSLAVNHWATALLAAGNFAASAIPRITRSVNSERGKAPQFETHGMQDGRQAPEFGGKTEGASGTRPVGQWARKSVGQCRKPTKSRW